jgi:iron complex outermembrane recepter protein
MKYKLKTIYPLSALTLAMALSTGQVYAQEDPQGEQEDQSEQSGEKKINKKETLFETIQITAQKREASIQSTPISVTAISGDVLDQMGITNMDDFQFFAPGLTITNDSMAIVNIRGIGTTAFGVATDPSSTIYIDGIYQPRPTTGYQDMFDVERIELLRGPQGVLFGRNSVGGALNIISKAPTDDFEGSVGLTLGNYNKQTLTGTFSGGLTDNSRGRITLLKNTRDGVYTDMLSGDKYQNEDTFAGRGTLAIDLSDKLEMVLRADYNNDGGTGYVGQRGGYTQDYVDAGAAIPKDDYDIALDYKPKTDVEVWGVSSTVTWTGDDYTIKSISSYRESDFDQKLDADATEFNVFNINFLETSESFTQELQLSNTTPDGLDWITGLFYLKEDGGGGIDLLFDGLAIEITEENVTEAYAAFGQMTYEVSPKLRATFGLRYSYESKDYGFVTMVNGSLAEEGTPDDNWSAWTPRFALDYDLAEDVMIYASATNGFKSGGFQIGDGTSFDQEDLWSYETGIKSTLLDNRLRANVGLFYYDYTNLQVVEYDDDTGISTTTNAGEATIQGIEGEFVARVSDNLDVNLVVTYTDAQFDFFPQGEGVDFKGNDLPNTPNLTYSLGAQYTSEIDNVGYLVFRGDYAWRDSVYFKSNNEEKFQSDSYSLLNLRVSLMTFDDKWEVSLYGTNMLDERYANYITAGRNLDGGRTDDGNTSNTYGEPRQYGIKMRYNF